MSCREALGGTLREFYLSFKSTEHLHRCQRVKNTAANTFSYFLAYHSFRPVTDSIYIRLLNWDEFKLQFIRRLSHIFK